MKQEARSKKADRATTMTMVVAKPRLGLMMMMRSTNSQVVTLAAALSLTQDG